MGALTLAALVRALGRGVDPVYYLVGDEDILKDEAVVAIAERVLDPAARPLNLDDRRAGDLDPESFHTLVNTVPLLTERRVVVIRGVEAWKRKPKLRDIVARYVAAPAGGTVLVLVQSAGEKPDAALAERATLVALDRLKPERVGAWLRHRAKALGLALEPEAAEHLQNATGGDLAVLEGELSKLAATLGERSVTLDDVTRFVGVRHGETPFDLVDAIMERESAHATDLLDTVLGQPGVTGVRVVMMLGTALLGTRAVRAQFERGARGGALESAAFTVLRAARPPGLRSWHDEAARWARWATRWTDAELIDAMRRALDADRALKSAVVSREAAVLERLVLALAPRHEAA